MSAVTAFKKSNPLVFQLFVASRVMFCKSCLDTKCRRETDVLSPLSLVLSRTSSNGMPSDNMSAICTAGRGSAADVLHQDCQAAVEDSQEEEEEEEDDWTVLVFRSDVCWKLQCCNAWCVFKCIISIIFVCVTCRFHLCFMSTVNAVTSEWQFAVLEVLSLLCDYHFHQVLCNRVLLPTTASFELPGVYFILS